MNYRNLFLLSFVSKKVKKLIKYSQMKRFESIDSIRYYCCLPDKLVVYVYSKHCRENVLLISQRQKTTRKDCFQSNLSGKIVDFLFPSSVALFDPWDRDSVFNSIHNNFLDFFGDSLKCLWPTNTYENPVPQLRNMKACFESLCVNEYTDLETLNNFFALSPAWEHIHALFETTIEVGPDSKFYQAESIEICQKESSSPAMLLHFQGRQAFIKCEECEISDLIEFVNRWKLGEGFQNLEYLRIDINSGEFSLFLHGRPNSEILKAFEAKHINRTKQPPTHTLPRVYLEDGSPEPNTDPITSRTYVVRKSDNRVASVLIQKKTLRFGVWDKTEEEFLGMLE
ncbi:hypothetical protein B9Z55_001790 [Caenorhabditis nigoni]|nr:hypothetical protein B9Z55_001790 [Caenorhabditis nigoni]